MTRDESIALYEHAQTAENKKKGDGATVWNAWAEEMLAKKAELERSGEWECSIDAKRDWREAAKVDFSYHTLEAANFSGRIFPAAADFNSATFNCVK